MVVLQVVGLRDGLLGATLWIVNELHLLELRFLNVVIFRCFVYWFGFL